MTRQNMREARGSKVGSKENCLDDVTRQAVLRSSSNIYLGRPTSGNRTNSCSHTDAAGRFNPSNAVSSVQSTQSCRRVRTKVERTPWNCMSLRTPLVVKFQYVQTRSSRLFVVRPSPVDTLNLPSSQ